jgi:Family of unknown function (DUF6088)
MRDQGAISMIRRYINVLPEGKIFSTRDVLTFGMRAAVDQALHRLVVQERIRRLARGVFVKETGDTKEYPDAEIARVKAESFGRVFATHSVPVVDPLSEDAGKMPPSTVFLVNGRSSKFHIGDRTIYLKGISPRKLQLASARVGEGARVIWRSNIKLMPSWPSKSVV